MAEEFSWDKLEESSWEDEADDFFGEIPEKQTEVQAETNKPDELSDFFSEEESSAPEKIEGAPDPEEEDFFVQDKTTEGNDNAVVSHAAVSESGNTFEEINEEINEEENEEGYAEDELAPEEPYESTGAFLHITPSQKEMFKHLSLSEKAKGRGILSIVLGLVALCGTGFKSLTLIGFALSGLLFILYAAHRFGDAKREQSYVSDTKRGYLRIESGFLHAEQGVGRVYEEIHIPIRKIKETLAFGNAADRLLALKFDKKDGKVLVNGSVTEEELFELRGGIYEATDWKLFTKKLNEELSSTAQFDANAWEDRHKDKALFIVACVIFGLSLVMRVLLFLGIIAF